MIRMLDCRLLLRHPIRTTAVRGSPQSSVSVVHACGSAEMLGWLVYEHGIEPHVFDKSARKDGTFSRENFHYDHARDVYLCPAARC